jgi:WD40 repeat protein
MYKVFLSSTSRDLADYREAVHRALDGLGLFQLIKMEDFGARDANAKELCARRVRESDLLVGLMGHYYGSCPPGEAVSFTELEYRTAKDAGLPRLMFAAPDDFPIPASLRESDASFARQQALRCEVMTERVVAAFDTPEKLASAVTKALFVWHEERRKSAEAAAPQLAEAPAVFETIPKTETVGANPYRGLEPFRKEHAELFFGREAIVDQLWNVFLQLHATGTGGETPIRLLAVLGASGSGKSSVAQAGLLPRLQQDPLPGIPAPLEVVFRPEARPLESLAVALARAASNEFSPARAIEFEQVVRTREGHDGLRYLAERMLDVGGGGLILLVDQFEELYSLCNDEQERAAFIGNLLNAAREPRGRVSIILTLRSDFLGAVNHHPELSRLIARQNVLVPVMGEDELRRAIAEPAKRAGHEIDESTVDLLIEQTLGREGALPALEFVLTRIWEGFRNGVSSADTVREFGGVGGALAKEAKRLYESLSDDQKTVARRAFLAMTMLGEGTKDTRRRASIDEMITAGQSEADVRRVLEIFADPDRRLITLAADKEGRTIAEVAHEALFEHWAQLREWLARGRDDLRFQRRLTAAAAEWADDPQRPEGLLWQSPLLDLLNEYHRRHAMDMTPEQLEFLEASRALRARREQEAEAQRLAEIEREKLEEQRRAEAERQKLVVQAAQEREAAAHKLARRTQMAAIGAGALALVAASFGGYSIALKGVAEQAAERGEVQRKIAQAERDKALRYQSLLLAATARQETASGKPINGILVALEALPKDMVKPDRPYVVEAEAALYGAVLERRELYTLEGHTAWVRSAAFSPDGTRVVTASDDATARLWDAASGEALATLEGHTGTVNSAAFSPDGTEVVTASNDNTARVWDAASGEALVTLDVPARVWAAAFSPDGTRVVTASEDATARLWDAASGEALTLEGHTETVNSVAFSPDGTRVVTASADETARLWDAASGEALVTLEDWLQSAAFSPDGTRVVTTLDNTARLWDAASGKALATLSGHTGTVNSAVFSPDGTEVVTASDDNTARLWDAASGEELVTLEGHTVLVLSAAFSPDGTRVVTASADETARLWDAASGEELVTLEGHTGLVWSAAFSSDGTRVVTASDDQTARVWDAATGKALATLDGWSAAFSPDGTRVVTASHDNTARVWDAASGEALTLEGHTESVNSVAFSPDGTRVVTASDDHTARLWDAASGEALATLEGHTARVWSAAFSPDGTRVVTASDDHTARLWDAASGKELVTLEGHTDTVLSAAFSPDGTRVVTASWDRTARTWRVFRTTQELISYARSIVPRQLTPEQRKQFFLE